MENKRHNGWTNYATWRVNLEFFSDNYEMYAEDLQEPDLTIIKDRLQTDIENYILETSQEGLAQDYAFAFLNDVNYYEIAEHVLDWWNENKCPECNADVDGGGACSKECEEAQMY